MELVHGGDWMGYREQFGRDALDFSANVSPLGLPKGVADAITAALPQADRYPDPLCRTLRAALSEAEGLPADQILCGNGAADLIFRLALAVKPRRALVTAPTFAEYATALETVGCTVERFTLNEANDFAVTEEFLDAIVPGVEIVFLCQPNNPTGQLASPALVRRAAERCAACGAVLAVDECFWISCRMATVGRQNPCCTRIRTSSFSRPLPSSTAWQASGWATASVRTLLCWKKCGMRASPGRCPAWLRPPVWRP